MMTPPDHLKGKYNLYAITLAEDYTNRASDRVIIVHVARPIALHTFCNNYIFEHLELTKETSGLKVPTNKISGLQKIPNDNIPDFEITADGVLKAIG